MVGLGRGKSGLPFLAADYDRVPMILDWYFRVGRALAWICGIALFLGLWVYCISTYGFLFGVGLGWLPAGITASVVGLLLVPMWGIAAAAILLLAAYLNSEVLAGIQSLLIIVTILGGIAYCLVQACNFFEKRRELKPAPPLDQDYLDWANREGKWAEDRDDRLTSSRRIRLRLVIFGCAVAAVWAALLLGLAPTVAGLLLAALLLFGLVVLVRSGSGPR
jgi:hypothetical protein